MDTEPVIQASNVSAESLNDDLAALSDYHAMSALAAASVVLGLASSICILGPMLLIVPLAGVATALVALRRIANSEGALTGRRLALLGLTLSVVCAFSSVSYATATRNLRVASAEYGRLFIAQLLAGHTKQAYRIAYGVDVPKPGNPSEGPPTPDGYQTLIHRPAVEALLAAGPDADVRVEETIGYSSSWGGEFSIRQQYVVMPRRGPTLKGGPVAVPFPVYLTLHRAQQGDDPRAGWVIATIDTGDEEAERKRGI